MNGAKPVERNLFGPATGKYIRSNDLRAMPRAAAGLLAHTRRPDLERVFVIGRFYRTLPGPVKLRQHLLGRSVPGIDDPVQRLEMTGLVASQVVDATAPSQAGMR